MRRRPVPYSAAELRFVEAHRALGRRELLDIFARTFGRSDVTRDDLKGLCSRKGWTTNRRPWSAETDALIRQLYPDTPTEALALRIGRTVPSTYNRARKLGVEKSAAYLASPAACRLRRGDNAGIATRFVKGQTPQNKGTRCAPGRGGRHPNAARTHFKKGQRSGVAVRLYKPIGTERLSKDGYLERKVNDGMPLQARWRAVHRIRWEEINGAQPKGMALKCLDGNKLNTDPSNWLLVPRGLLPRLNGPWGHGFDDAPAELKPSILALAKLEHAAAAADRREGEPAWKVWRRRAKRRKESAA